MDLLNPSARAEIDIRSIFCLEFNKFKFRVFLFSETSCHTKIKEPSLPYYLLKIGGGIVECILFPRVLVQCEMQIALIRFWTCFAVLICHNDNHYITETYRLIYIHERAFSYGALFEY